MTFQLSIGEAMHTPNGNVLYPVYLHGSKATSKQVYITAGEKAVLVDDMTRLFEKCNYISNPR